MVQMACLQVIPNDPSFENQQRISQYYLSLDIDLSRIKTKSHLLKTIFDVLNVIKIPFPTLELNSQGQLKGYILYFLAGIFALERQNRIKIEYFVFLQAILVKLLGEAFYC
jgi:hypothetical protein